MGTKKRILNGYCTIIIEFYYIICKKNVRLINFKCPLFLLSIKGYLTFIYKIGLFYSTFDQQMRHKKPFCMTIGYKFARSF